MVMDQGDVIVLVIGLCFSGLLMAGLVAGCIEEYIAATK